MENLHIVYISDANYEMPTCISILSLKKNCSKQAKFNIHIMSENLSESGKEKILSLRDFRFEIDIVKVDQDKYKYLADTCLSRGIHVTQAALHKFDIPNVFINLDKILYLDGDTLINKDITALFDIDISDAYVISVDDMGNKYSENSDSVLSKRIGISGTSYFNSGVMLLNLERMRKDNIYQKLITYRVEQKNYFMDQDAFNSVLSEKRLKISCEYNFLTTVFEEMDIEEINNTFFEKHYTNCEMCLKEQTVIHMSGKLKPWNYHIPWVTEMFLKYYNQSPYKDCTINFLSPLKVLNCERKEMLNEYQKIFNRLENAKGKIWGFPFTKIKRGSRVILYGAGAVGDDLYRQATESGFCQIKLWVDKDFEKKSALVVNPEKIQSIEFDYIVIAISRNNIVQEIRNYLKGLEIEERKIVSL